MGGVTVRRATAGDADLAADLAEERRVEYEPYSPVFWRPAADARERHRPFLAHCIGSERFSGLTAERDGEAAGIALATRHGAPPPFHADPEPTWCVDDFFVAGGAWEEVGAPLLDAVAGAAAAAGAERLIVISAHADRPKCALLERLGFRLAASWWVLPVEPAPSEPVLPDGVQAVTGPAPPIYDPGGLTALATAVEPGDAEARVAGFVEWSRASGAALALVAASTEDDGLAAALEAAGFAPASAWYVRRL